MTNLKQITWNADRTWVSDEDGNKNSIERWGSEEAAEKALLSLKNCSNCSNCSNCTGCTGCTGCSYCYGCTGCTGCSNCSGCSNCFDCSNCSGCSDCSSCFDCSRCSGEKGKTGDLTFPKVSNLKKYLKEATAREDFDLGAWEAPCGSPLCLGGHIVHAAGEEGLTLKDKTSWVFAGVQIAKASGLDIPPTWFFGDTSVAIKRVQGL